MVIDVDLGHNFARVRLNVSGDELSEWNDMLLENSLEHNYAYARSVNLQHS